MYSFKYTLDYVMSLTRREALWLVEEVQKAELYEMGNKISLAGGDGDKFIAENSKQEVNDYTVDKSIDLIDLTYKLRGK